MNCWRYPKDIETGLVTALFLIPTLCILQINSSSQIGSFHFWGIDNDKLNPVPRQFSS